MDCSGLFVTASKNPRLGVEVQTVLPKLAWVNGAGNVLGCYLHGMFESQAVMQALWGRDAHDLTQVFSAMVDGVGDWFAQP